MNWGLGISLVYGAFALGMVSAAVIATTQHDPGLVSKEYYRLDLDYQAHLEKKQRAAGLGAIPVARYQALDQSVVLQFPSRLGVASGTATLTQLLQDGKIVKLDFTSNSDGLAELPVGTLPAGRWRVELDWQASQLTYFNEGLWVQIPEGLTAAH